MRSISADEIARMAQTAEVSMADLGTILTYTEGVEDAHGKAAPTHMPSEQSACGYRVTRQAETWGTAQVPAGRVIIRWPTGTVVTRLDRVRIDALHGVTLSPARVYAVDGDPIIGVSCVTTLVKDL